jgi:hypothetical protein
MGPLFMRVPDAIFWLLQTDEEWLAALGGAASHGRNLILARNSWTKTEQAFTILERDSEMKGDLSSTISCGTRLWCVPSHFATDDLSVHEDGNTDSIAYIARRTWTPPDYIEPALSPPQGAELDAGQSPLGWIINVLAELTPRNANRFAY